MVDPVGIGARVPRLSWKLKPVAGKNDLEQTGYRVIVASNPSNLKKNVGDLWDSGEVRSSETFGIEYAGRALTSNLPAWWKVLVIDQDGQKSDWSNPGKWSMGLLSASDWKADWIGFDEPRESLKVADPFDGSKWIWLSGAQTAVFETTYQVGSRITAARARVTADDQFELLINGQQVAKSSGNTDAWRKPALVDIKPNLAAGPCLIQVRATNTGGLAGLLAALEFEYADGRRDVVRSGPDWKAQGGAVQVVAEYGADPWGRVGEQALLLPPPRLLRKDFELRQSIKRAVLYGTAYGNFELHLNGRRVANEYFMPGWTEYGKRVYARGYDVTSLVKAGSNALGIVLADGWYSGYVGYGGRRDHYGTRLRAKAQLIVEYSDGSSEVVASTNDWKAATGPIQYSDFLMGEYYDAQLEMTGWDAPGYDERSWHPVEIGTSEAAPVEPFVGQPVVEYAVLKPKTITNPAPDTYVLDLGQNLAGFARIRLKGQPGQKLVFRFAERLNPDGTMYTVNLRGAKATDTYICKGVGVEEWSPRFTFHGFQYIEVTGLGRKPKPNEIVGVAVSSDTPTVGKFESSDPMLNRLVSNAWWTQRMNFIDIPTDCPQRDERLGWTGDAQAYIYTASMLCDVQPFFTKWLTTLDDSQRADGQFPMVSPVKVAGDDGGPAWADAGVICPWTIYQIYGDKRQLAEHYPAMKRFVEFCRKRSTPDLLPPERFHAFGDWVAINAITPPQVIYQSYFAGSARIVAQAAKVLGYTADAAEYEYLYQRVRAAFQKAYVAVDGVVAGNTQCAYVLALAFDLLDSNLEAMAAKRLVDDIESRGWHLNTGFVGTRDIMHVLSKIGRDDVAFRLLHNKTFPSWGFTIANGATSIWERWDGWTPDKGFQDPGMNSFAHYAFGAIVGWMFAQPGGITPIEAGFGRVKIAPKIDRNLKWLKCSFDSVRGPIQCNWSLSRGRVRLDVSIPPNVRAEVHLPDGTIKKVGSGDYTFYSTLAK